jgi:hypothetical protein
MKHGSVTAVQILYLTPCQCTRQVAIIPLEFKFFNKKIVKCPAVTTVKFPVIGAARILEILLKGICNGF